MPSLAGRMEAASPNIEKQGFFTLVFVKGNTAFQKLSRRLNFLLQLLYRLLKSSTTEIHPNPVLYLFRIELLLIKNNSILEKKQKNKYLN
ncbi:hypothetical protein [Flavobacterium taihuense]|uniref:Uncharacterized protein n=1 Tax=Flavobacterium taihuense TaxID=2857508 RepID=A0ABS6XZK3_9FLAO|nr:hypothetical protein [Flavobacterium taihuense]MBW4362099.1 hypothetical protein [Flavobacterium taihuense]